MHEAGSKGLPSVPLWPSIDIAKPEEEGGPIARAGFTYQDEVAVGFLIEMLENPTLLKVHCETHDDVVVVRQNGDIGLRVVEYVQVKASEDDKFWSVADLCQRKKGKEGTSIFETSLRRDKHDEPSTFRIVTLRPVAHPLKLLTHDFSAPSRAADADGFNALCTDLETRLPGISSPKGNGPKFWLENCVWDERHSHEAVSQDNLIRLIRLSAKEGSPLLVEFAEVLLLELRAQVRTAGDAKWDSDRDRKIVLRETLCAWWQQRKSDLIYGATVSSGGKLANKMDDAGLPNELIGLAQAMRRGYAAETRAPKYMEPEEAEQLQLRVQSEVVSLQARLFSGQLELDGPGFHLLCLDRMDALSAEGAMQNGDRSAFLKGCMYDIADRCLLRFARRS